MAASWPMTYCSRKSKISRGLGSSSSPQLGGLGELLLDDLVAQVDALVADVDARAGDELLDLLLALPAERALQQVAAVSDACHEAILPVGLPGRRCSPGTSSVRLPATAGAAGPAVPGRTDGSADPLGVPARAPCPVPVPRRYRQPSVHPLIERRCRRGVTVSAKSGRSPAPSAAGHGPAPRRGTQGPWPEVRLERALRLARTSSIRPYSLAASADEDLVALDVRLHLLDGAAGVLGQRLLQPGAHAQHLVGLDLDVASLAVVAAGDRRLVDQDPRVRQGEPLARARRRRAARRRPRRPGR